MRFQEIHKKAHKSYLQYKKENSDSVLPGVETANAQTVREVGFTQTFIGANRGVLPKAGERAIPILNFFTGNKKTTEVPTYNDFTSKIHLFQYLLIGPYFVLGIFVYIRDNYFLYPE